MSMPTLLDIAIQNGSDGVAGLIDEATKATPEVRLLPARTIKGQKYKTKVRTSFGRSTGSFRAANDGSDAITHVYENRDVSTYIIEARWEADKAVADRHEDGAAAYIAQEAEGVVGGEMVGLASQFYYGTGNSAAGYPGLIDMYDATNMAVDAAGTTANTGSSVWLVRAGVKDVIWVWGEGGALAVSPVRTESIIGTNSKKLDGYVQTLLAYPGLQVGSQRAICRIKKLTADSGKGLTDALIAQALAKFPAGFGPTHCFMSLRSLAQLQASRTATNPTGAPAAFPVTLTGVDGATIPIHVSEAISNTEPLTL